MKRSNVLWICFCVSLSFGCGNDFNKKPNNKGRTPQTPVPNTPSYDPYASGNPGAPQTPVPGGTTPSPGGTTPGPGTPATPSPETPLSNYYTIKITAHGNDTWKSDSQRISGRPDGPINYNTLLTDKRFKLRVKALAAPQRGKSDDFGVNCRMAPVGYRELGVDVRVSSRESGNSGQTHTFSGIQVGQVSAAHSFAVPASNHALVLTVSNAQWDHSCTYYKESCCVGYGYRSCAYAPQQLVTQCSQQYGVSSYCPYSAIWKNDCYQIELQFVTDHTSDF